MLTADDIRRCAGRDDVLALFRQLGYPIGLVPIDPAEWRSAGIEMRWNGEIEFHLAARARRFDLFLMQGVADEQAISRFLTTYQAYNTLTKSAVVSIRPAGSFAVYDLSSRRVLRRLDIDPSRPSPHALDRLNLLELRDPKLARDVFDLALDRERVTRKFFEAFRGAARRVTEAIGAQCPGETNEAAASQAVLIMSRLLFLSFIQEKGWLNEERRFLFDRIREADVFRTLFRPLFFGCLNTPVRERDRVARALGRIPYLNGGLFEPSPFEYRNAGLDLPDELVRHVVCEVFEKFDFRSDEGDTAGTHVDPEMLGKVFESLMADDERATSGSFYTPRAIVDVLTERAVRIALGDAVGRDRLRRLQSLSILDPACGSGAFLLSALGIIEKLTMEACAEAGEEVPAGLRQSIVERSLCGVDLKAEAVRLCELRLWLAIVSKTDVAIEEIPPLPNLDRNVLQGNALLSPTDFLGGARAGIYAEWVYALRAQSDLVDRYKRAPKQERPALARLIRDNDRRLAIDLLAKAVERDERELQHLVTPSRDLFGQPIAPDAATCMALQERIAETRAMVSRIEDGQLDFFSFDVYFAPVMQRGGFDVVVGNPPWVRNARIDPPARRLLADRYVTFSGKGARPAFHQPDLSVAFMERSLALVAPHGVASLLLPSKVASAAYASSLRREVDRHDLVAIDDWSGASRRHFDANTFPLGITVVKRAPGGRVTITENELSYDVQQSELRIDDAWALLPQPVRDIMRRLRSVLPSLTEALHRHPLMGVKTGNNGLFFLGECGVRAGRVVTSEGIGVPLQFVARCVRGRNLRRWTSGGSEWILWPPVDGWRTPPSWLRELAAARQSRTEDVRLAFVKPEHVGIKVAWKDVSRGMAAAVLPDQVDVAGRAVALVPNQTLYFLDAATLDEAYAIAAVLNSTIADALILATAERAKDAHFRYFGRTVASIPFPDIAADSQVRTALVRASRRAHRGAATDREIDEIVAQLYDVSRRDLALLRRFADERLARCAG